MSESVSQEVCVCELISGGKGDLYKKFSNVRANVGMTHKRTDKVNPRSLPDVNIRSSNHQESLLTMPIFLLAHSSLLSELRTQHASDDLVRSVVSLY